MRYTGTLARGIRLPIIKKGDALADIVTECVTEAARVEGFDLHDGDVIGVTEAVVAKAQGNYASLSQVSRDIRSKFPGGEVGVVFPIMSRNRFINILKGIAQGADKVFILLSFPTDEVGNPVMDAERIDEINDLLAQEASWPVPAARFREIIRGATGEDFKHPFTDVDYISLYESIGAHVRVYFSNDPRDILKLTPHVLAADIHTRFRTKKRLEKAGAETVYTLSDIMSEPFDGSGYNPQYGVLGSNISTDDILKLFPRGCDEFVRTVRDKIFASAGVTVDVMVYGDGAFKDPSYGIWELADPVVSPGFTERLSGRPNEIKIKMVADRQLAGLPEDEKEKALRDIIRKKASGNNFSEGTTPRKYADLIGSLCDLMSGSGDKGTPVVLIQGYFDDYSTDSILE